VGGSLNNMTTLSQDIDRISRELKQIKLETERDKIIREEKRKRLDEDSAFIHERHLENKDLFDKIVRQNKLIKGLLMPHIVRKKELKEMKIECSNCDTAIPVTEYGVIIKCPQCNCQNEPVKDSKQAYKLFRINELMKDLEHDELVRLVCEVLVDIDISEVKNLLCELLKRKEVKYTLELKRLKK